VTVIEVYPNGNLLVSGEKQIGLKEGEEFIRFSGVVNPEHHHRGEHRDLDPGGGRPHRVQGQRLPRFGPGHDLHGSGCAGASS
jgi:hypothetical protein